MPDAIAPRGRRARVLELVSTSDAGGAERAVLELVKRLDRSRFAPTVASLRQPGALAPAFRAVPDATFVSFGAGTRAGPGVLPRLVAYLRRQRFDLVHTYCYQADFYGRLAARLAGVPVLVSSIRNTYHYLPGWAVWLDGQTARLCDQVTAVSEATRQFAVERQGMRPERVLTIPNGVDLARFTGDRRPAGLRQALGLPPEDVLFGAIGRLAPQKNPLGVVRALAAAARAAPRAHLLFVGEGPLAEATAAAAREHGVADRVHLLGRRDDVPAVMAELDAMVLFSNHEGMPNVVLEAFAAGLAVCATAVDGTRELITNQTNGLLVAPGDEAGLAAALVALAADGALRCRLAAAGRQLALEHFDIARVVARVEQLYRRLLAAKAAAPVGWQVVREAQR